METNNLNEELIKQKQLMGLSETPPEPRIYAKPKSFYKIDVVYRRSRSNTSLYFEEGQFPFTAEGIANVVKSINRLLNEYDSSLRKITIRLN